WRFVHLPETHDRAVDDRLAGAADLGFLHFQPQVVAFAGALAHAGENRESTMNGGNTSNQLGQDDGLAQTGTAEETNLAAADEGRQQVDDLDAGLELFRLGRKLFERRGLAVDRPPLGSFDIATAIDGIAQKIENAAQGPFADRNADRRPRIQNR